MKKYRIKKQISVIIASLLLVTMLGTPVVAETEQATEQIQEQTTEQTDEQLPIPEERQLPLLVDDADLLTDSEEEELETQLDEISERQQLDVAVVTVNSLDGKTAEAYADDFYDYNGYGYGDDNSGILLLISMEDRDWHMTTCGFGITAFTDAGMDYMQEQFVSYLSDGEYMEAFQKYATLCDDFITQADTGEPYDSNNMPHEPLSPFWIFAALLLGFIIAFIMASGKKSKLKSVKKQVAAKQYTKKGSLTLTRNTDQFINRVVTSRRIERDDDSSSGGGSSVHTSSSGTSHGGSGGKF